MLASIIDVLADPADGSALRVADNGARVVSESGHSYDVAKQGYVTLAAGSGLKHHGDTPQMIADRERFLSSGFFAPFVEAVSCAVLAAIDDAQVPDDAEPVVCEVGAGTGYYLAHCLDTVLGARGVGLDASVAAAKHLARCHPRAGAVVADAWSRLPLRDESLDAVTAVFAPRNPAEFARVLKPQGQAVLLIADPGHLNELREPLGILDVEKGKVDRLLEQSSGHLELAAEPQKVSFPMKLDQESIAAQIGMSPSARHIDPTELTHRVETLPATMSVTARATITRLRRVA